MSNKYIKFIKDLSDDLTTNDVEQFIFLLRDTIPAGKIEKATNSLKLFELLEHENIISVCNVDVLEEYFKGIRRMDLIEKLDNYKKHISSKPEVKLNEHGMDSTNGLGLELKKFPKEDGNVLKSIENIDDSGGYISPNDHSVHMNGSQGATSQNGIDKKTFFASGEKSIPASPSIAVSKHPPETRGRDASSSPKLLPPNFFKRSISPISAKASELTDITVVLPGQASGLKPRTRTPPALSSQKSSQYVGPEEYDMENSPHGDCIIFSNRFEESITLQNGNELTQRNGTEKDVRLLRKTFEFLGFTVTIHRNQTAQEIKTKLQYYAQTEEQESNDCFVCCVLSHGYEGGFYGNDGEEIDSKAIKNIFTGDCCPSLVTKPKLFFIQACQGDTDGKYARLEADTPTPIVQDPVGDVGPETSRCQVYKENIAADADILFFMATTPGTTSWRDPANGSWFVQTLCKVFQDKAHVWNLMDLLLQVNNEIALMQGRIDNHTIAKQMSNLCENTLRKQLRFFPGTFVGTTNQEKVPAES